MEFFKKNYEKILLSVVLLGLAVAAGILAFQVKSTQDALQAMYDTVITGVPKPAKGLTREPYDAIITRSTNFVALDLNVSNRVFNPSQWRRKPDGSLVKGDSLGANALRIKAIKPLELIIEGIVQGTPDKPEYLLQYECQYEKLSNRRSKTRRVADTTRVTKLGDRVSYKVVENQGTNAETLKIVLDLVIDGEKETVTLAKDTPFKRALGYAADLDYPPDPVLKWNGAREGQDLPFAGDTNNIVAIKKDSVVVSANSTGTRTYLSVKAAP